MSNLNRLLQIMKFLRRDAEGCAWTKQQTHTSLVPYLIEESYETAACIDEGTLGQELRDELGDVLLQVVFHAEIAEQRGAFTFDDVAAAIADKLERRYPTLFGDEPNTLKTAEEIDRRWQEIKDEERKAKGKTEDTSILDEISHGLPALLRATKLKERAARNGWEWRDTRQLLDKINEEINSLQAEIETNQVDKTHIAAELGEVLFLLADFGRCHGVDAEEALRTTNNRFERRFRFMERGLKSQSKNFQTASDAEQQELWDQAKTLEKQAIG